MVESGTVDTVDFQKSQDSTFVSLKMVCLYFKNVNWLKHRGRYRGVKDCFMLIGIRFGAIYAIAIVIPILLKKGVP